MIDSNYNQTLTVALVVCLAVGGLCLASTGSVAAQQGDSNITDLQGSGTAEDPYLITTVSELQAIRDAPDARYELTNNIEAAATSDWNSGAGFEPIGTEGADFTGHFDGNGYTIEQLTIKRNSTDDVGLFGEVGEGSNSGVIESVHLTGVTVSGHENVGGLVGELQAGSVVHNTTISGTVTGQDNVGGLVGDAIGASTIRDAAAAGSTIGVNDTGGLVGDLQESSIVHTTATTGTVNGSDNSGGLVGTNIDSVVTQSASNATIIATGEARGGNTARGGGLVGGNYNGAVINQSFTTGVVDAGRAGGIAGENFNSSRIATTYTTGSVNGTQGSTGGIVGGNFRDSTVTGSYWNTETTGQTDSPGSATGLTTAEMTGSAARQSMDAFDFENTWTTTESYPVLHTLPELPSRDNEQSAPSIVAPPDSSYSPTAPFTIGTFHDATGTIDSNDVAIRLVNATADNGTVVTLNDAVSVTGEVNTTIPAGSLSEDVTVAVQLYNLSTQQVVASDTVNLTADVEQSAASVTFTDQTVENGSNTVAVASTTLPEGGFVAIHSTPVVPDNGTAVDSVVGVSKYLENGTSESIMITLDAPVSNTTTLVAMPHQDTNGNETYDFVTSGGEADGPYTVDGAPVTDSASITAGEVEPPGDIIGSGNPAQDPDNDGTFEDVNGDGEVDIVDVNAIFQNRNSNAVQNNPTAFDFNGDSEFNIVDVNALFTQFE